MASITIESMIKNNLKVDDELYLECFEYVKGRAEHLECKNYINLDTLYSKSKTYTELIFQKIDRNPKNIQLLIKFRIFMILLFFDIIVRKYKKDCDITITKDEIIMFINDNFILSQNCQIENKVNANEIAIDFKNYFLKLDFEFNDSETELKLITEVLKQNIIVDYKDKIYDSNAKKLICDYKDSKTTSLRLTTLITSKLENLMERTQRSSSAGGKKKSRRYKTKKNRKRRTRRI